MLLVYSPGTQNRRRRFNRPAGNTRATERMVQGKKDGRPAKSRMTPSLTARQTDTSFRGAREPDCQVPPVSTVALDLAIAKSKASRSLSFFSDVFLYANNVSLNINISSDVARMNQ